MTRDITPDISRVRLFLTEPHNCSYLHDQQATTAFVDPQSEIDVALYTRLSEIGFRRSGPYLYTPHCVACQSCVPARIPVSEFKPDRSQKRCWDRNREVRVEQLESINFYEHYALYERYISERHSQGDMYPPSERQFREFLGTPWECTRFLEFRMQDKLAGCAVIDVLENGISAIYTYFDPSYAQRSLGNLGILFQIYLARRLGLQFVYLGYWISDCRKMSYKTRFRPVELYRENRWKILD